MRRFTHNPDGFSSVDESPDGELVRYEDHAADRAIVEACLALDTDWLRSCEFSRDMRIVNFARAVMRMKESRR